MDVLLITLGILLMLAGIAGSILPFLPGPPLCYAALLIQQFQTEPVYSQKFLVTWAIVTVVVTAADYIVPLLGTRRFGGTRYGMWGCTIGLLAGLWLGPWGIIAGPFIGAFVGEWLANSNSDHALRAAVGSFVGFLFGTLLKLVACFGMGYYFIEAF